MGLWNRILPIVALLCCACATAPVREAWRPWVRTQGEREALQPGAALSINVAGETSPLLGGEELLQEALRGQLALLLERRGFRVVEAGSEAAVALRYRTTAQERTSSVFTATQRQFQLQSTGSAAGSASSGGLGVAIATAVARAASSSSSTVTQVTRSETVYTHVLALEIEDAASTALWKGEASWESALPDLQGVAGYALRLLCAELPTLDEPQPVPAVKRDRYDDFLRLEIRDRSFASPALPNPVSFYNHGREQQAFVDPIEAEAQFAMPAFLDLLQTAEYALPEHRRDGWSNPLDPQLWRRVTLGGRYLVGAAREPVAAMIDLTGNAGGYRVARCWLAGDDEYARFQADLSQWRERLREFFDVYE
jgi:hypothetical protein